MVGGQVAAAAAAACGGRRASNLIQSRRRGLVSSSVLSRDVFALSPCCRGDEKWVGCLALGFGARLATAATFSSGARPPPPQRVGRGTSAAWGDAAAAAAMLRGKSLSPLGAAVAGSGCLGHRRASGMRDLSISVSLLQAESGKGHFPLSGSKKLYFDTHALVCVLEKNGFSMQQSEIIVSALMNIMNTNMDVTYKDMVTKVQQEIALQQIMSHIGGVKKDMIILEKSEFSALRAENEDEITKVRTDSTLDFNIEKSRGKELYSLNDKKLLEIRTEIMELHSQQDRSLTQTDRKIDTEVAGLKTMLESHKLDTIKYLAGSVFTCLTVALGFYRLWI
uniref:Mitochondrial calcium uniporter regulator 1 n=1 Tax=Sphenodon punctatus TaxID=8508 RepID=A0A8D0GYA5_SPHPU